MRTDNITADIVKKAYAYLTDTNTITTAEGNTLKVAYARLKNGSPLSARTESEVEKMISLYRGMTAA